MADPVKCISFGSTLYFGDYVAGLVAEAVTLMGQLTSIDGPNITMGTVDVTDTETAVMKDHLPAGIADLGEISGTVILDPLEAGLALWKTAMVANTKQTIKINTVGSDGVSVDYVLTAAIPSGITIDIGATDGSEKAMEASFSMKCTDDLTMVAA